MSKPICFISDRAFRWMSNFYGSPFRFEGVDYPTVEHAFQCCKTLDKAWRKKILTAKSPGDAKRLGRQCPIRSDWEKMKVNVMLKLVREKFRQNPELAKHLVATGQRSIQEDSPWDSFWGTGKAGPGGRGRNEMGNILKKVRRELGE
jgi:ribA/ribD-fused uncharacterized protein